MLERREVRGKMGEVRIEGGVMDSHPMNYSRK